MCVCKKCLPYNYLENINQKNELSNNYNLLTIDKINKSYITYYKKYEYYHYLEIDFKVGNGVIMRKICCNKCFNEFIKDYCYERFGEDNEGNSEYSE